MSIVGMLGVVALISTANATIINTANDSFIDKIQVSNGWTLASTTANHLVM